MNTPIETRINLAVEILQQIENRVDDLNPRLPPELYMQRVNNAVCLFCALDIGKSIGCAGPI